MSDDRGSTIPLILGFFLVALLVVAGSVALGDAFVQQRSLQDICDGAAAAAASAADLERGTAPARDTSLRFAHVETVVSAYLARDPARRSVHVNATLSRDRERITLTCEQTTSVALGVFFGRGQVHHTAHSSVRAAVLG
jgi:uncharacterized membrane protein